MKTELRNITFEIVPFGHRNWKAALDLKERVLRKPLSQTFTSDEFAEEENHLNIVGMLQNQVAATALLVQDGNGFKMQRVAVEPELRNQKIGQRLLAFCETLALEKGAFYMYCHARNTAINFYAQNGYTIEGDYFMEDDVPHVKMQKQLRK